MNKAKRKQKSKNKNKSKRKEDKRLPAKVPIQTISNKHESKTEEEPDVGIQWQENDTDPNEQESKTNLANSKSNNGKTAESIRLFHDDFHQRKCNITKDEGNISNKEPDAGQQWHENDSASDEQAAKTHCDNSDSSNRKEATNQRVRVGANKGRYCNLNSVLILVILFACALIFSMCCCYVNFSLSNMVNIQNTTIAEKNGRISRQSSEISECKDQIETISVDLDEYKQNNIKLQEENDQYKQDNDNLRLANERWRDMVNAATRDMDSELLGHRVQSLLNDSVLLRKLCNNEVELSKIEKQHEIEMYKLKQETKTQEENVSASDKTQRLKRYEEKYNKEKTRLEEFRKGCDDAQKKFRDYNPNGCNSLSNMIGNCGTHEGINLDNWRFYKCQEYQDQKKLVSVLKVNVDEINGLTVIPMDDSSDGIYINAPVTADEDTK